MHGLSDVQSQKRALLGKLDGALEREHGKSSLKSDLKEANAGKATQTATPDDNWLLPATPYTCQSKGFRGRLDVSSLILKLSLAISVRAPLRCSLPMFDVA